MDPLSLNTLLMVFGGGVIGAALGGLWAIIICAIFALLGIVLLMAGGSDFLLLGVAFGPIFGPHVGGFGAGLVAGSYAVWRGKHPSGAAKDILTPLIHAGGDTMLVGGVASVAAHLLLQVLAKVPLLGQSDLIAVDLFIVMIVTRLIFHKEGPLGNMQSIKENGLLNTKDYSISWGGWQSPMKLNIPIGIGAGILSASLAMGIKTALDPMVAAGTVSGVAGFVAPLVAGWALSLVILIPLQVTSGKIQQVPIMHCFSIMAAWAFMYTGSILVAAIVAVLAGMVQELCARVFYNHGSTHIDPPAVAIMICTFLINIIMKPEFLNVAALFK